MTPRLTPLSLAVFLALGAVATAGCGSKESSGPAVVPGAAAGDVREVTGTVTAQRGDEPARTLAVGDVVSGDDLIKTAAGSSIVIELRHNGVRWSLAADHSKRLGDSQAWKAPRRGEGGATGERSTAAGRHAEREAADTAATAATESAPAPVGAPAPGAAPAPTPVPPPEPVAVEPEKPAEKEAPPRRTMDAPKGDAPDRRAKEKASGGGGSVGTALDLEQPKPTPANITISLDRVSPDDAKPVIDGKMSGLRSCWQSAADSGARAGTFTARLAIDAAGKVTKVTGNADGDAEQARSCLVKVFERMTFPAGTAETVTATLSFGLM
jgi:hypothetical protein